MDFLTEWIVPRQATVPAEVYIPVTLAAFLLTAVSKGGFGGGVGALSIPLMLCVTKEPLFALGMWLPFLVVCDAATIHRYPKEWRPSAITRLLPGALAGILATTVMLGGVSATPNSPQAKALESCLRLSVAVVSTVFLLVQLRPQRADGTGEAWAPTWPVSLPVGFVAGVTTTIAHAAGPVITLYLLPQKMPPRVFVGTSGRYYLLFNALKIPFMVCVGVVTWSTFKYGVWLMLLAPLGIWFGAWLNSRLNAALFVRIIQVSLLIAAAKLGYDGLKPLL